MKNEGRNRIDLELVLRVRGTIRGAVVRPDGAAAAGRVVQLMGRATGQLPKVTIDASGRFEQTGLIPGRCPLLTKPDATKRNACGIEREASPTPIVHMMQRSEAVAVG